LGEEGKEKRMRVKNIEMHYICVGRGHNDMYWKLLNNGGWEERGMEKYQGVELTKIKYIHSWDTLRNAFEH
jgi:hypothetical protein